MRVHFAPACSQWRELDAELAVAGAEDGWSDGAKLVGAGKQVGKGRPIPPGGTWSSLLAILTLLSVRPGGQGQAQPSEALPGARARAHRRVRVRVRRQRLPRMCRHRQLPLDAVVATVRARDVGSGHRCLSGDCKRRCRLARR